MKFNEFNSIVYNKLGFLTATGGAMVLLALWAFFEASFWFIIPDFFLLILCIFSPNRYKKFFLACILFSLMGISAYFLFTSQYPAVSREILTNTPFINAEMLDKVGRVYSQQGVTAALKQTTTVIPVKVWTFQAVNYNFNFFSYLFLIAISRAIRMFLVCFIFSYLGKRCASLIRKNAVPFLMFYLLLFFIILFYIT